jgi:hypothetical protein
MSIRNVDRHGLESLKHGPVKPLDRLKIPPIIIYLWVFGGLLILITAYYDDAELHYD